MRHRKKGKKLNRNSGQRKALFKNLIESLILKEEIKTTESKAKAIRGLVDKLVNKAKKGTLHNRRQIMAFLPNKEAVNKLIDQIAPRFKQRIGGFTRFMRIGRRRGDNAMMVKIGFVKKEKRTRKKPAKPAKPAKKQSVKQKKNKK